MLHSPKKSSLFLLPAALLLLGTGKSLVALEGLEHFEKQIRPLLMDNCISCHGPGKQDGGLRLDAKAGWKAGGKSGPSIVPGDLAASALVQVVRKKGDFQTHPKLELSKDEVTDIELWIQMGAPDPRTGKVNREALPNYERAKDFWSFQPIKKPAVPSVSDEGWARGAIDKFVLTAQEKKGLKPVADASRTELARRVYFALIGLPPTPEQVDTFVADERPDAFEDLVDELLSSPHFGERWGRHWLDVARFAESSGGGRTLLFKDAWRFRDYVIQSFNADMPYDQFVREQLAGDLLPYESAEQRSRQITATAFLALGPTNYELQDKQLLRYDVIDEQIDTLGKAFMGMTLGCARCHDHKFDPVPTADYYAMAGIFKSTRTLFNYTDNVARWIDTKLPLDGAEGEQLAKTEAMAKKLSAHLNVKKTELKLLDKKGDYAPKAGEPKPASQFAGIVVDERAAKQEGDWKFSQYSQNYIGEGYYHDGDNYKGNSSLTFRPTIPFPGRYEVRLAYSEAKNRSSRTPVTISHAKGETSILVNQREAPTIHGRLYSLGEFWFEEDSDNYVRVANTDTDGFVVVDAVQWLLAANYAEVASPEQEAHIAALIEEVKTLEAELTPLEAELKKRPLAMSVLDDTKISDSAIRIRGEVHRLGESIPRGFLQVATLGETPKLPDTASGRRELAEWMVSPEHPLTSRVMANRIWSWLFGTGLVRSVDNLGTTGELPSHPELLDHLAIRLQENDWSIKATVKEILLSRTWQLSSKTDPKATELDPDNRLLTSYPRRRLDAEQLRDAILAVNGKLDLQMYGPNIEGAGEINANSTAAQLIEYNYVFKDSRRSVYTPAFRVKRHELFELFDFGNVNFTMGQRNTSTVALQALYMLNNPFVIEQSRHAAELLLAEVENPEERIDVAFRRTLGRVPSAQEWSLVNSYLEDGHSGDSVEDWASVFQTLFGSVDFRYLN
ncbi:MAG: DUF1553 domain-containing protein [Verrucomicrobia bacterium]|nr:DUF1553 domain-containing protein [Verrucomicrobiota bacterium]